VTSHFPWRFAASYDLCCHDRRRYLFGEHELGLGLSASPDQPFELTCLNAPPNAHGLLVILDAKRGALRQSLPLTVEGRLR